MLQVTPKPFSECHVLIADDDSVSRAVLSGILEQEVSCSIAKTGEQAISMVRENTYDLLLLDINMPGTDGLEVCRTLKSDAATENLPVIFVTATIDAKMEDWCWEAGASDYLLKPVTASTLVHRVKNHLQSKLRMEMLESMMLHDALTGVYNRQYLKHELPRLIRQLARYEKELSAIVVDIDFFKKYNDRYGHLKGDECLSAVADILAKTVKRASDIVIRFGGEEFLIFLADTSNKNARDIAQKMIDAVRQANLSHYDGVDGKVSISAGVATCLASELLDNKTDTLIERADQLLLKAKAGGRNQVKWK